jgi:hypothetical protein
MPFHAYAINNVSEHAINHAFDEPWFTAPAVPSFPDRAAYKRWLATPGSVVPLFSLVEGETASLKVSASNPAYRVHGLVVDYDTPISDSEFAAGCSRFPAEFPPFAFNRSRSGGVHVVWRFEEPTFYYGADTFKKLMGQAEKALKLNDLFPGYDAALLTKHDQTYTAGDKWTVNENAKIKKETLGVWLFETLRKTVDFDKGLEIPFEILEKAVHAKFPGRWTGPFQEGARGIRFFDPVADNPTAAIVRKTGMTCFTGDRPFLTWAEIFGGSFVREYQENRIGRAVNDLWCDGESFYRKTQIGDWDKCGIDATRRHLKAQYALSGNPPKGEELSEVERAIHALEMTRRVAGALPFPHRPAPEIEWNGKKYLNDSTCSLVKPVDETQVWGVNFPWIADFTTGLMRDQKNLDVLLSEVSRFLKSCHAGFPCAGHTVFLAGPPGTGKTFWSRCIAGQMLGGYSEVTKFLVKRCQYNSAAFEKAWWVIDDATPTQDLRDHRQYSAVIKALTANPTFPYEKKFGYAGDCPFSGRLFVTLNIDPESILMLPDTEASALEKITMLMTSDRIAPMDADEQARYETVNRELPFFVRWLLDYETPAWIKELGHDDRFGFRAWQDPDLLEEVKAVSVSQSVLEAVSMWLNDHTEDPGKKLTGEWVGLTSELLSNIQCHSVASNILGKIPLNTFGRHLSRAAKNGCTWIKTKRAAGGVGTRVTLTRRTLP